MADDDKKKESSNVMYLKSVRKKKEATKGKNSAPKGTSIRPKSRTDLFITDERFKRAMELVQKDMNQAFTLSQTANSQFYFLFQFLVKKGIVDEKEYETFLEEELDKIDDSDNNK